MTDLLHILPEFNLKQYSHILPSLEKALISTNDILTLDAVDVAKRALVPPAEVRKIADDILVQLHSQLGYHDDGDAEQTKQVDKATSQEVKSTLPSFMTISTLDEGLDVSLRGGFPAGHLSEVTGERYVSTPRLLLLLGVADTKCS